MTAETSNARLGVVAWFPTNAQGEIIRTYGDGSPVYACRTKEEAEQAKRCHLGATGPVIPLYAAPPPAAAEPKTLPVPTRVYLTDKAAVIVGDPQCGWDEEGPDAHNCDAMGCASIGPHVLARVPFTVERPAAQQQQGQAVAWADEWRAAVAAKLSSYGLSEEAAAVFASSELDEYKAGLCDCAENDPVDMVDLMMGVARDAIEKWKIESAGRPFGHKNTAPPPSAPVGVEGLLADLETIWHSVSDDKETNAAYQRLKSALAQQPAAPVLAKYQPCGCVICTCEDEQQCQGCGAKHCGNRADHPPYVAQQPAAVDETAREDATPPATSPVRILIDAIESEIRQLEGKADWKSQTARIASLRAALDAALAAQHQEPTT